MNPMQFVFWLKGYLEAAGEGPHVDAIRKALADVVDVPTYTAPYTPVVPSPLPIFTPGSPPNWSGTGTPPVDLSKVYCTNGASQ